MITRENFFRDTRGDAVVEAAILFPIIIMIFAGLAILAMYLPERAALQRATQYATTAIATEQSDTWLYYDETNMKYQWETNKDRLENVYVEMFSALFGKADDSTAEKIITKMENENFVASNGKLEVSCRAENFFVYKEFSVTATRTVKSPVNLSLIGFPAEIPITVTSTAVIQNGDEFVRNMDISADFISYLNEKYNLGFEKITEALDKVWNFLGVG